MTRTSGIFPNTHAQGRRPVRTFYNLFLTLLGKFRLLKNTGICSFTALDQLGRAKRICYLSPMRAAKVQASLRIRAVSPEPSLLAHTSSELRGTFRQKAKSLAPLNGWACAVKICHDGMLEDTNSLGGAHFILIKMINLQTLLQYYNNLKPIFINH